MTENNNFGYTFNWAAQISLSQIVRLLASQCIVVPFEVASGIFLGVWVGGILWVHIRVVLTQEFQKADALM